MNHWELIARIAVGTVLGGVIGYERDLHGRPAGLRTHMIVALAASTFMVISTYFVFFQHYTHEDLVAVDTSRIAASIVTGIGFLAGGAILRTGANVQGLTTAAGLWLVAAIGMASGAGMYFIAGTVTFIGIISLTVLRRFEDKNDRLLRRRISLVLGEQGTVAEVSGRLAQIGAVVSAVEYDRKFDDKKLTVTLDVRFPEEITVEKLLEELEGQPGIRRVRLEAVS